MDSGLGKRWASPQHQCLRLAGSADTRQSQESIVSSRRKPGYGLTRDLKISSMEYHGSQATDCLANTWRAMRPSKEMPPHTILDPLVNGRKLQASECSPRHLQTHSCLLHVLSVTLLSSVKSTGCQRKICIPYHPHRVCF